LRNEPVAGVPLLPLTSVGLGGIAVLGPLADIVNLGDAGSSEVWAPAAVTIAAGLRDALPRVPVIVDDGLDLNAAGEAARRADVAVVVVGDTSEDEGEYIGAVDDATAALLPGPDDVGAAEAFTAALSTLDIEPPPHVAARESKGFGIGGDRTSLRLHDHDVALIRAAVAANPRTIVAVVAGSAVVMSDWVESVPAVVIAWYGGIEAGHGFADVIVGAIEPTGRLPFSIPTDESHLPNFDRDADTIVYDEWHGWWKLDRDGHEPAFSFGFGLSYTTLTLESAEITGDGDDLAVDVLVNNTGTRTGTDLILVFGRHRGSGRPARLIGFGRVAVGPGATAPASIPLRLESLNQRDVDAHTMKLIAGTYDLTVARNATDRQAIPLATDLPRNAAERRASPLNQAQ
jgi:beta-glucosidase